MTGGTVMVAVPCRSQIGATAFEALTLSMLKGADWWKRTRGQDAKFGLCVIARAHIVDARLEILKQALANGADYVWWLDDDMTPPPDTLERLFAAMESTGAALAGAFCFRRGPPYSPCAFTGEVNPVTGKPYCVRPDPPRIAEASATGFACLLMDVKKAGDVWDHTGGAPFIYKKGMGEDAYYCANARAVGQKIVVDTGLVPGHIGEIDYNQTFFDSVSKMDPKVLDCFEPITAEAMPRNSA